FLEGKLLRGGLDEAHALSQPLPGLGEHLGALVDPDDGASLLPDELERHRAGAAGDVEHGVPRADREARDEELPPARVLPEGEKVRVAVVGRPERREEPARDPCPGLCPPVSLSPAQRGCSSAYC